MKTELDGVEGWLFEGAMYDEELRLFLVEGFEDAVPDEGSVGEVPIDSHPLVVRDESRRYELRFPRPFAWQCRDAGFADEDLASRPDDDGVVQILEESAFMATHGAGNLMTEVGPYRHYRITTEDELIDIISDAAPVLRAVDPAELTQGS